MSNLAEHWDEFSADEKDLMYHAWGIREALINRKTPVLALLPFNSVKMMRARLVDLKHLSNRRPDKANELINKLDKIYGKPD